MSTSPRARQLTPSHGDYKNAQNILEDMHRIYRDAQPRRGRIFSDVPILTDIEEGEQVWVDNGSGTLRGYVKLNGTLRYWDLT